MYFGEVENGIDDGIIAQHPDISEEEYGPTGEFQKIHSVLSDGNGFGISSIAFDPYEELMWVGTQGGHVTSYYGENMEKYTSFQVHASQEIRQIVPLDEIILVLNQNQLRGQIRRGIPVFTHTSELLKDMQCMLQTSSSNILLGGHQEDLIDFDLNTSTERKIPISENGCGILKTHSRYICCGDTSGNVHLLDPRTFNIEQSVEAHTGSLSDMDVHGNLMVTCGFSARHMNLSVDRFIKIYDLRVLRALPPIQVSIDPFLLRFMPSFSSRISIISSSGQLYILETQAVSQSDLCLYQVTSDASMCLSFDVSSSCHHLGFGDSSGSLHLFSSNPTSMFNGFSRDTEFADPVEPLPYMSYTDEMSFFSSVPLPLSSSPLLSDWPSNLTRHVYRKAPVIDPNLLASMKMNGTIGYCKNSGNLRRNQIPYKLSTDDEENSCKLLQSDKNLLSNKNLLTGKLSGGSIGGGGGKFPGGPLSLKQRQYSLRNFVIPKRYSRMDWKKNLAEENENEHSYNKTKFCGLESNQANSYCNTMIQLIYHIDFLRASLLAHSASVCKKEYCLSCEFGFLFHMMDRSKVCLSSNFLRAFRVVPEASALGLILQESQGKQRGILSRLIQSWNRFILHQIETETMKTELNEHQILSDPISKLFAMQQENGNRCMKCNREEKKESKVLLSNLLYSADATCGGSRCRFVDILQRSLCPDRTTPAWCDRCQKYQPTHQCRIPKSLPAILSINTCLDNAHDFQIWKNALEAQLPGKMGGGGVGMDPSIPISSVQCPMYSPGGSSIKICRYGKSCTRADCKFWHEGLNKMPGENEKKTEFELNSEVMVKWLIPEVRVQIEDGRRVRVFDFESIDAKPIPQEKILEGTASDYKLFAVVCFARDSENEDKSNLVSLIDVSDSYFDRVGQTKGKSNWLLFNDFYVKEISLAEAVSFNPKWKVPCVVYYRKSNLPEEITNVPTIRSQIRADIFKDPKAKGFQKKRVTYKPLDADEIQDLTMKKNLDQIVAMDAEFVTLGQEETELRSDGKLATVKPQQLSLARVTCLRGSGPLEFTPFIDDYIATQEVVVDYLTKFSGIKPGDLDANFSSKNLTILKTVYLKLRFLIDSGVKFVGHGLNNDFRVINLVVEPEQVIDTVNLFWKANQRMISLRFLAWHFLGMIIQSEVHDSAEDAKAALLLYRKYEELKIAGKLEKSIDELYEFGKKINWIVPNDK